MSPSRRARPPLTLSLQFADPRHRASLPRHRVARWMRAALDRPAELTVRIVDADEARELNRTYRGRDYPTNVLTFGYLARDDATGAADAIDAFDPDAPPIVADVVVCAPVVEAEAHAQGLALDAHYAHLLVHGALHAQGMDHETDADARAMEARESALMAALGLPDPYARR